MLFVAGRYGVRGPKVEDEDDDEYEFDLPRKSAKRLDHSALRMSVNILS